MKFEIKNIFVNELPVDAISENYVRPVTNACYSICYPTTCSQPKLIHLSESLLDELGLGDLKNQSTFLAEVFSGNRILENAIPYSMSYAGHQFGQWAGQLGDGRAINLFERIVNDKIWTFQIKGAGKTPYSRKGDGYAVLRSSIREYLCSEAMHHLGIPTTRALSLVSTGDMVLRDMLYNGNEAYEQGAIVCRIAPTFIRFGNFELLTARQEIENLKKLTDFTIRHFFPELNLDAQDVYLQLFSEVAKRTMQMILHWQRVGFVHGVMNTDNMSILGLTIDYGPYGWMEDYNPNWTPNTTDYYYKRYAFGNQPDIALWNLVKLANALFPLIQDAQALEQDLKAIYSQYQTDYKGMMLSKIGLLESTPYSKELIQELEALLFESEMDMTLFFRKLSDFDLEQSDVFLSILNQYSYSGTFESQLSKWQIWFSKYRLHLINQPNPNRKKEMDAINPKFVLRNYMAQLAINAAEKEEYSILNELFELLKKPYDEQPEHEKWFAKRPDWAKHKVGCSMLSCSS